MKDWGLRGGNAFALRVGLHGTVGGTISIMQGGQFGSGFLAAGFASGAGGALERLKLGFVGQVMAHAIVGGGGSVLGGGKFENGAVTGAFGYLFNEAMHGPDNDILRGYSDTRSLTQSETSVLQSEFPGMDTGSVGVSYDMSGNGAYTPGNTIHFPDTQFGCQDFSACGDAKLGWFVHEGTHVWQNQNGNSPFWGHLFSSDVLKFGGYFTKQQYMQTPSPAGLSTEKEADWHKWNYLCKAGKC